VAQKYVGSPDELSPALNLIHLCRRTELWYSGTFLTMNGQAIDLINDFSRVSLQSAKQQAILLQNVANVDTLQHTRSI
jgi:hypothetical protein